MEKFCPACGRVYTEESVTRCEADDEKLVILQNEPDLVGTVVDGKYEIRSRLGEGGMGTVYLAHHETMDRDVAIKVLKPQYSRNKLAIKRFHREARAASKLTHPNTITVYDSGQTEDGLLYQVMEKLSGKPLGDILDDDGAIAPKRAIHILSQVCDSLAEAHQIGITHRDLKPENIFIESKFGNPDFVKVLDFGIAKMSESNVTQATATGMICGTPSYMSPEQAMGRELDGRSDIYALGVLLFEMLTCERPFEGETPMEVMLKHINGDVPDLPPDVDGRYRLGLDRVIKHMLSKHAVQRPADCQVLKAALVEIIEQPGKALDTAEQPAAPRITGAEATITAEPPRVVKRERDPSLEKTGISPMVSEATADWQPPKQQVWLAVAFSVVLLLGVGGGAAWYFLGDSAAAEEETVAAAGDEAAAGEAETEADSASASVAAAKSAGSGSTKPSEDPPSPAAVAAPGASTGAALGAAGEAAVEAAAPEPKQHPPALLVATVSSEPIGATVKGPDDETLGETPLKLERAPGAGVLTVTVTKDGYRSAEVAVDADAELAYEVTLKKKRKATAGKSTSKGSSASGKGSKGSTSSKTTKSDGGGGEKPKAASGSGSGKSSSGKTTKTGKGKKGKHGFGTF